MFINSTTYKSMYVSSTISFFFFTNLLNVMVLQIIKLFNHNIIMVDIRINGRITLTQYLFNLQINYLNLYFCLHELFVRCHLLAMVVGSSGQILVILNPLHILGGFNVFWRTREPYYVRSSFLAPLSM